MTKTLLLAFSVSLAVYSASFAEEACEDVICPEGTYCAGGRCIPEECNATKPCPRNMVCRNHKCTYPKIPSIVDDSNARTPKPPGWGLTPQMPRVQEERR